MEFGITLKGDFSPERTIALTRQAESAGFTYGWVFDSHVLWQDAYVQLGLMAQNTERMRLGTCVTNPRVRTIDVTASALATLNRVSGGRMVLGMGRGDSSRRVMDKKPTTIAVLKQSALDIRELVAGREAIVDGHATTLEWAEGNLPLWLAGYGPKVCRAIGEVADGVILQFADPFLIQWCLGFVKEGAQAAGRDFSGIEVMAAAPVWVSEDIAYGRQQVWWFPAMVGNHVADLVMRYGPGELPEELTAYIKGRKGYDYRHHGVKGADHLDFVTEDIVDRFCIVGSVQDHVGKLQQLRKIGVSQFNIYLMCGEEEKTLLYYGNQIIPALRELKW